MQILLICQESSEHSYQTPTLLFATPSSIPDLNIRIVSFSGIFYNLQAPPDRCKPHSKRHLGLAIMLSKGPGRQFYQVSYNETLGNSNSPAFIIISMSTVLDKFKKCLPCNHSQESNNRRNAAWERWDTNLHGFLRLQDLEDGIRRLFDLDASENISLIIAKAHRRLRQTLNIQSRFGSNYLEKKEFRLFLENLTRFLEKMLIFEHFDSNKDNKIGCQDLAKISKVFQRWSVGDQKHVQICQLSCNNDLNLDNFMQWIESVDYYSLDDLM